MRFLFLVMVVSSAALAQSESLPGMQGSRVSLTGDERIDLRVIDDQIQLLEFQKVPLSGPTFLTIVGAAGTLGGVGMMFAVSLSVAFFFIGIPVLVVGVVLASIGVVWLMVNLGINRRLENAIQALHDQRPTLARRLERPEAHMVTLVTF